MRLFKGVAAGILLCAAVSGGAFAQGLPLSDNGASFLDAVRSSDGDKAIALMQAPGSNVVNYRGDDGSTALNIAAGRRDEQWLLYLLGHDADPNLQAQNSGDTAMITAARVGFDDGVKWLLQVGARVDLANRAGETALIVAVQNHQTAVVKRLLEAGANADKSDHSQGFSARDYAKRDGSRSADILKLMDSTSRKAVAGPVIH